MDSASTPARAGTVGDVWDAQKDMLMDTLGAIATVLLFLVVRRGSPTVPSPR